MNGQSSVLRSDLLAGSRVLVRPAAERLAQQLAALGAELATSATETAEPAGKITALVHDARTRFAGGGAEGLQAALSQAWAEIEAAANRALLPGARGGRIVVIAPPPDAGPHAAAARDALENLARTLSIEWARFMITTVAIAPGATTAEDDLAGIVAYLLSPAGGYFSGCRLDLT
jgi:hypothetical protein